MQSHDAEFREGEDPYAYSRHTRTNLELTTPDALIEAANLVNKLMREDSVFDARIEIRFKVDDFGNKIRRVEVLQKNVVLKEFID